MAPLCSHTLDNDSRSSSVGSSAFRPQSSPAPFDFSGDFSCATVDGDPSYTAPLPQDRRFVVRPPPPATQPGLLEHKSIELPETYLSHAPIHCICQPTSALCPLPTESDEQLLAIFRSELMPQHPFVVIPRHVAADALAAKQPFLMSAVRMVATLRNPASMHGQMYQLMSYLADHMLLRAERSLDLLMGIVVVLGWYHHHCVQHSQHNNLLCLAESLVADLGLGQPIPEGEKDLTIDEKRLLLGVWYLRSCAAMQLSQLDPVVFTPYMCRCLATIEQANEHPADELLVHFVKIQNLTQRIAAVGPACASDDVRALASVGARVSALERELSLALQSLPQGLKTNPLASATLAVAAIRLGEVSSLFRSNTTSSKVASRIAAPATLRQALTTNIKMWFDSWLAIPASKYYALPSPVVFHLVYAATMAFRLAQDGIQWPVADDGTLSVPGSRSGSHPPRSGLDMSELGDGAAAIDHLGLLASAAAQCAEASALLASSADAADSNFWGALSKKLNHMSSLLTGQFDLFEGSGSFCGSSSGVPSPCPSFGQEFDRHTSAPALEDLYRQTSPSITVTPMSHDHNSLAGYFADMASPPMPVLPTHDMPQQAHAMDPAYSQQQQQQQQHWAVTGEWSAGPSMWVTSGGPPSDTLMAPRGGVAPQAWFGMEHQQGQGPWHGHEQ